MGPLHFPILGGDNMLDVTDQAILTLSKAMRDVASKEVGEATFARFYQGKILKNKGNGLYRVDLSGQTADLRSIGNVMLEPGQTVYVVSPQNSNNMHDWVILGGIAAAKTGNADHDLLMNLASKVDGMLPKSYVVQTTGSSTMNVMSQKAVTDALAALSGGNYIQGVMINGTTLQPTDHKVNIPLATNTMLGVVKGGSGKNMVAIQTDGSMKVESVGIMTVTQDSDEWIVFNGGDSTIGNRR